MRGGGPMTLHHCFVAGFAFIAVLRLLGSDALEAT
jgi:hypothetical protein